MKSRRIFAWIVVGAVSVVSVGYGQQGRPPSSYSPVVAQEPFAATL